MQKDAHIPNDPIFDILRSLPAKSLVRFKCVCKSWLSFISQLGYDNEEFILPTPYCFHSIDFHFKASGEIKQVMLGFPPRNSFNFTDVIGSCNGLVLLCEDNRKDGFRIWNPWTQRYKVVSSGTNVPAGVTNPNLSVFGYGFGYDHSTDDYIIVIFIDCISGGKIVKIYSRKTDSWFQMGKLPKQILMSTLLKQKGFFVNGALYWHAKYYDNYDNDRLHTILCFDLVDRKFRMIVLPDDHDKKPDFDLDVLGGQLCMINYDHDCHSDIWALEGSNYKKRSNWIKLMSIPSDHNKYLAPVSLMKNGEVVMRILQEYRMSMSESDGRRIKRMRSRRYEVDFQGGDKNLFIYNQKNKTLREVKIPYKWPFYHKEITYTRSLVSPASDAGDDHASPFCDEAEITLICRDLSDVDIAVKERNDELQQHSTSTTGEYEQEIKPVICEHLLSEFGSHCKSSTSRQWTIELDRM